MGMFPALGHSDKVFSRLPPSERRFGSVTLLPLLLCLVGLPAAAKGAAPAASSSALLPSDFAGWQMNGAARESTGPQAADAANVDVLRECGFQRFVTANYSAAGDKLSIRAIQFQDASGAFCAFTFYRRPGSLQEQIGRTAAWDGSHALFWTGNTLVDATFDHLTAMSAAQLRELAGDLPSPSGSANIAPSLPAYLPRADLSPDLTRYALGPESYARGGGVLPSTLIDFADSAEAVTATYTSRDGDGRLTLLEYPTPQIAAARLRAIDAFLKAGNTPQAVWPQALAESHPDTLLTRRSGPIVAITSGGFSADMAHRILNQVNYQADVVWNNPQGYVGEASKVARLFLGVFAIVGILGGAAILLGLFLGGGRALVRTLRGKSASTVEEIEFISLNLGAVRNTDESRKE